MRNLVGLEMTCFGKSGNFELIWEGGSYLDPDGQPVTDLVDLACYVCTAAFYTREGDAIAYCPNCGHIDRKRFDSRPDLVDFLRGNHMGWLSQQNLVAATVETEEGNWQLRFAPSTEQLERDGRYRKVRAL